MGEISIVDLIIFIILLGAAFLAMFIAASKGRRKMLWFALGLILGPIAVVIVYRMYPAEVFRNSIKRDDERLDTLSTMKQLLDRGEISQEEYEKARAEYMTRKPVQNI